MTPSPWQTEIIELHDFFQHWLGGSLPATEAAFARLPDTMAEQFSLISPTGQLNERESLLKDLWIAHGSRPDWSMWIERPQLRYQSGEMIIATYEEWQRTAQTVTARLSSVVFQRRLGTPNGLVWLHVHETWLPGR